MKIGVIQASSQADKHALLLDCVRRAAEKRGHSAVSFGCLPGEAERYSYIEIALEAGLLLASGAVDFIVSGCSSGQGMMLALNSLPGVVCGYAPTPQDAFLYGRINGGNAVSLPLGLNFGWMGDINLACTLDKLFDGPFGEGWPPEEAERKRRDNARLLRLNALGKRGVLEVYDALDPALLDRALSREIVTERILREGTRREIVDWVRNRVHA